MRLPFGQVNDNVEFYLVEQGKEEADVKKFSNKNAGRHPQWHRLPASMDDRQVFVPPTVN